MSKPVKGLIIESYKQQFAEVPDAVVVDVRGVEANDNNALRSTLAQKDMQLTVVKNALARVAFKDTSLEPLETVIVGPCALVYGGDNVVQVTRELLAIEKKYTEFEIKGAVMEGELFGPDRIKFLSKMPTRDEALSDLVGLILSPGRNLAGAAKGTAGKVGGLVDAIKEKLEAGEAITKVA